MLNRAASRSVDQEVLRGLTLIVVVLPLFFFPKLINLYSLPKETLLAFLTAVLSWLWLLGSFRPSENRQPQLPLLLPLSLFLAIAGLSLIHAVNFFEGLRHFFHLALGVALFWITVNHMNPESASSLFRWIVVAGSTVSFIGIIQTWGVDIPTLIQVAIPSSTFGNKNMASQYILLVLPIAFYRLLSAAQRSREWLHALLAATILTYLTYTSTRAAWGAATVSLLILWFSLRARGVAPNELLCLGKRKWALLASVGLFVLGMNLLPPYFLPKWRTGWKVTSPTAVEYLSTMVELERNPSVHTRVAIWANSLALFKEHALLGVGKGNFQFIYPLYHRRVFKDPTFSVAVKANETHNDYVQLLTEVGILGTSAFLWFLILLGYRYWRSLKQKVDPLFLAVGFGLTEILLVAFWDFPLALPVPTAFFWIFAGLLWRLSPQPAPRALPPKLALGIAALLTVCTTAASIFGFMHFRAEFYYSRADRGEYQAKTFDEKLYLAKRDFDYAIQLYPYDYHYYYWKAVLMLRTGDPQEALQAKLRALALNPYHVNTLNNLGVIYVALGNLPKAIQAFETALKIFPEYVNVHNNLGQIYEKTGAKEKAIEEFRKTIRIDPENPLAQKELAKLLDEK